MLQTDWLNDALSIHHDNLSIRLLPDFISAKEANTLLNHLIDDTPWQQPRIKVFGKWHPTPRLVSFHGERDLVYVYSQTLHGTQPWSNVLLGLKSRVSIRTTQSFNSVLLNYYRNGQDTMGWHADDEKALGKHATIASLSIGAARDIHFKSKTGNSEMIKLNLPSGSLLIMDGDTQQNWMHHIPKRVKCVAPRINLTFRNIIE